MIDYCIRIILYSITWLFLSSLPANLALPLNESFFSSPEMNRADEEVLHGNHAQRAGFNDFKRNNFMKQLTMQERYFFSVRRM
jgi:hypothetical protein